METLVSTGWLAAHLGDRSLIVLDATRHLPGAERDAAAEYTQRHIPGAKFLDLGTLIDPGSPVPAAIPLPGQLEERLQNLGLNGGENIVLYDDSAIRTSARAWFILHLHGFTNIAVLDGGLGKWLSEGRAVSSAASTSAKGEIYVAPPASRVRTKSDMLGNIESHSAQVLDARDAARFSGLEGEGGHIPDARNLPFTALFQDDGTYRSPTELRAAFIGAGIDLDQPLITSCGSGMTASVLLFALHLIGKNDAALYDGSWSEWSSDPALPVEKGPAA